MIPASKSSVSNRFIPAFIALATVIVFYPALHNQFVSWDDAKNFTENLNFRGLGWPQIHWMFTTFHGGLYMPLTWLSSGLDYVIWGMNPSRSTTCTNILLHAANAVLFLSGGSYYLQIRLAVFKFAGVTPLCHCRPVLFAASSPRRIGCVGHRAA